MKKIKLTSKLSLNKMKVSELNNVIGGEIGPGTGADCVYSAAGCYTAAKGCISTPVCCLSYTCITRTPDCPIEISTIVKD